MTATTSAMAADLEPEIERAGDFFTEMRARTADLPGVTRPSYGDGEHAAHALAADWARKLDLEITHDYAGNQFMTLPGRDRSAPRIIIGSHMDSVPHGGNYDGAAGVVMGLAALDRLRGLDRQPAQDISVMAIRAEEACWFSTHYAGSRMAFGLLPKEELDSCTRVDTGRSLADHIEDAGFDPAALRDGKASLEAGAIRCYIEPHIEQGPALIGAGLPVGIVTGIRGNLRYKHCRVRGVYGHAGGVPRAHRRDAVFGATEFATVLEHHWDDRDADGKDFVCTVGEFWTDPTQHTMTKISGDVRFTMDIRSEDNDVLLETDAYLRKEAARIAEARDLSIDLGAFTNAKPALMDPALRGILRDEADALGIPYMEMASGAGHDCATFANQGVPSAMIFIRNDKSSHNPEEAMEIADFGASARLLGALLDALG
jgi:N-carbamoyl-L-amino-acid hydrolase